MAILIFYAAFIGFAFAATFAHELGHAVASRSGAPRVLIESDRDEAYDAIVDYHVMQGEHGSVAVPTVERTTIALYPANILLVGATLGLAPEPWMPDPVLASTFYAYNNHLASGAGHAPAPDVSTAVWMPLAINLAMAPIVWGWMLWRRSEVSMAAAWANAVEWGFNVHHVEALGWSVNLYISAMVVYATVVATAIIWLMRRRMQQWRQDQGFVHIHRSMPEPKDA